MQKIAVKMPTVMQSIGMDTAFYETTTDNEKEIVWKDFDVESNNMREGTMHLADGIDCPICKNRGKVFARKEGALYAHDCKCMTKRRNIANAKESGLGNLLEHRINNFITEHDWQKTIKEVAIEYAKYPQGKSWFVMLGQSGIGKTMICSAIARTRIEYGLEVKYCVWNDLIKKLKRIVMDRVYDNFFDEYALVTVLYIDDFLKGSFSEKDIVYAFDLINARVNRNLVTIISSERLLEELMDIDAAVAGRIKEKAGRNLIQIDKDEHKNYRLAGK